MSFESRGRGDWYDERKIERAAKYASDNGGTDQAIKQAAKDEFQSISDDIIRAIRSKINNIKNW